MGFILPDVAWPYAKLQRTLAYPDDPEEAKALYVSDVMREWAELQPHLPKDARRVMDFGCGIGAFAVLLWRHYQETLQVLAPRDGTGTNARYGMQSGEAFYNDAAITRMVLETNGVPTELLSGTGGNYDLIVSLLAWGYHIPIAPYLRRMKTILRPGGTLILDVRDGTGGEKELTGFSEPVVISRGNLRCRIKTTLLPN